MTKRIAAHTISTTIGALYLLLILGAPFCDLYHTANHHIGHGTDRSTSVCSWAHSLSASASVPSDESATTTLYPTAVLSIVAHKAASEFDFQVHPARSPPVFLS